MLAGELINTTVAPLQLSDTVQRGLNRMAEFHLSHLPLVEGKTYLGLIAEDYLLDLIDTSKTLKELPISLTHQAVYEDQHAYEVIRMIQEQQIDVAPVLHRNKKYKGLIVPKGIIACLSSFTAAQESGSILVLEISNRDNSLAHIAQIVEADQVQILSSQVRSFPDSTRMEVTLKLNRTEISGILSAFQRYNYTILGVYNDAQSEDGHSDHYDHLMNYLDL
jgi:acetoin utilization protein AcuB